ncbi:actin cortical patch protein [Colletotrichum chrysophilum]|uniref:Actin cortical patch protein n=1 Tax=Colletotrichum chrysophilum TaxID=1836956 RepID=A0AAD9AGS3_9PEZI|nr:actin cortical patch protein [Colletotrichum chrysophilum]
MKLTPIRVRGKRKAASSPSTPQPAQKRRSRLPARRDTKRATPVEHMPLEILERILLFSENLNLLRCNNRIGALLSGRGTLINVIISAFHSTWDCWFGVDRHTIKTVLKRGATDESRSFRRYEKFPELFPGDPEFQSSVLASSWINVNLIFEARQVWAWRFARDRWYSHTHVGPKDEESDQNTTISSPHDRSGGFGHFDSRDCFEYDWALYGLSGAKPTLDFYVDVHPKTTIPDDLITGPWTLEQQRLLFWLRRGGALIQPETQTWETLRMGLQNAVTHRNPESLNGRLIQMLLLLDDFFPSRGLAESQSLWPLDVLEEEHAKVEKLVSVRERSTAGPLYELIELERRMFDYHRREVDLLTSRLSRYDRMGPQSMVAVGLVPQPRNH